MKEKEVTQDDTTDNKGNWEFVSIKCVIREILVLK